MTSLQPVLILSNHGDIVGGGEVSLLALLEGLDRTRWLPIAVAPSEGDFTSRCRALGLTSHIVPFPSIRRPGPAMVQSVLAVRRLLQESGACLVHANGSRAMFYGGLGGHLAGRPVIWHVRVADSDAILDRFLGRLASIIIVNSRAVARRFEWIPPRKIRCIHNGVDLSKFASRHPSKELRRSFGLPENVLVVVSVGRFVIYKGYRHLLDAAHIVGKTMPSVHWVLVGDGELRGELEAQCRRLGLDSRVRFTGWREDVADILALGDLFVLPSLGEHFGRVLIEAMAMAKPVVATEAGGVPEVVDHGETGLLVPPADPQSLAEAMLTLLQDPELASRLGAAGRRRTECSFNLANHVQAVEDLYCELSGVKENHETLPGSRDDRSSTVSNDQG